MSQHRFQVNLGGMIEVLSDHLYSSPEVFIRELLQNAVDAIVAREKHSTETESVQGAIFVFLDGDELHFRDNGIGLSEEEIHRFLAIIGESSKKELEDGTLRSDYIGRFGIGLLSCFMVSNQIRVITRSVHEDRTWIWTGMPDGTYDLEESGKSAEIGTEIVLKAKDDCKYLFGFDVIQELLLHFGVLLPYPIYLTDGTRRIRTNPLELPWERNDISKKELLEFGQSMFLTDFSDCVILRSKAGEATGVAFFLPYGVQASVKQKHMIYLKNMFLTEKGDEILPEWAFFVRCIINSKALRPTASREGFFEDQILKDTRAELGKCISDYLAGLAEKDPQVFRAFMNTHEIALRSMAVSDEELFDHFIDKLDFQTTKGRLTGMELRMCHEPLVCAGLSEYKHVSQIYSAQNRLLINVGEVYSLDLLKKLADKYELDLIAVNSGEIDEMLKDVSAEEAEEAVDFLSVAEAALEQFECDIELKQFIPANLSAFYYTDENAILHKHIRNAREHSDSIFADMLDKVSESIDASRPVLYFNRQNPIIRKLILEQDEKKIRDTVIILYVQTLLVGGFVLCNNELGLMNESMIALLDRVL